MELVPTDNSNEAMKQYEELWSKIEYLIKSITNNSDNYGEKYMKINFNSGDELPLDKILELHRLIIVIRSVFSWKLINVILRDS